MVNGLKEYFKNTPKAQVVKDWEATRGFDKRAFLTETEKWATCVFSGMEDKSEAIIGIIVKHDISDYPYGVSFIS